MDGSANSIAKADTIQQQSMYRTRKIVPDKSDPAATVEIIKKLVRKKFHRNHAAGELAALFGLGDDVLAKTRTQSLFSHVALKEAFRQFNNKFVAGNWESSLPDWQRVRRLATEHRTDMNWTEPNYPDAEVITEWNVNHHYARFMTRVMKEIKAPTKPSLLLFWVRDADDENGLWVLFHTLIYLHLEQMRENQRIAPLATRIWRHIRTASN